MSIAFRQASLANGLNVIAEVDPSAHSAALGFFVKTGARDEERSAMGVSHFLEHMMFKGTAKRSAEEVDQEFDDLGAEHNAFTTSEMTAFWAHTLPEHLPKAQEILADILRPAIRDADFASEKKVILEEIAMYADNPFWVLYERAIEEYYRDHPLSHRVLGTAETISELSREQMLAYFNARYSADNTVVAAAGRLDFDRLVRELQDQCGAWDRTRAARVLGAPAFVPSRFAMSSDSVQMHYLLMLAPAPAHNDDRRYAAAMLAHVLGDDDGSRLHWALIETGMADDAQAQYEGRDGVGEYLVFAACAPANASAVEVIVHDEIDKLIASVTDDDLARIKSKIATAATLHGELPAGRMRRLGRVWTYMGEYRSLESELARINAVTVPELRQVWEVFPIRPVVTAHLRPPDAAAHLRTELQAGAL